MTAPKLLDLCARAGGASVGYTCAGFDVTAVDIVHCSTCRGCRMNAVTPPSARDLMLAAVESLGEAA